MQQFLKFITWHLCTAQHVLLHCWHHPPTVKPEAATAVVELLMMGVKMPETCWAVHKRQVINLRNYCIWLVDLFEMLLWGFHICSVFWDMTQCEASGSFSRVRTTKKDDSWSTWLLGTKRCQEAFTQQHNITSKKTTTLRFKDNLQRYTARIWTRSIFRKWMNGCQQFETPWNRASRTAGEKWTDRCNNASTRATVLADTIRTTAVKTAHNDLTQPTFHRVCFAGSSLPIRKDCSIETVKHWSNQSPNRFFIYIILTRTERVQTTSVSLSINQY
jgi:hypothetical protein